MTIYLDHAATTPMLPEVRHCFVETLELVGNPASIHSHGQRAKKLLEQAREAVAFSLNADPVEVIFTSGGTEAVNLGIKGLYWKRQEDVARPRLLIPGGEHHAATDAALWLEQHGARVEWLPIDEHGRLSPEVLENALARDPESVALVSVIWANNEVGTVQPIADLARVAAQYGVPLHSDAVAAYGYLPLDFHASGAAALSVSAHKIGGPVGTGALLLSRSADVVPLLHGGGQQRCRSGTQDVAGARAFATAATLAHTNLPEFSRSLAVLRDHLINELRVIVPQAVLRGDPSSAGRLPGNAHFTFPGCEGDSLLFLLDSLGFSVSTGSACQAGVPQVSGVLRAMGISENQARGALRVTLGHGSSIDDVNGLIEALPGAFQQASKAGFADHRMR